MTVREEDFASIADYARVPIAFEVRSKLTLPDLREEAVDPWRKDYDEIEPPTAWPALFDVANWGVLSAWDRDRRIGGVVVAWNTPGVDMLEGRDDLAVLWDIRVRPEWRGKGIGRILFEAAADWARSRGCTELKVETQDVNVPACRFYRSMGCAVRSVQPNAYEGLNEVRIVWGRRC